MDIDALARRAHEALLRAYGDEIPGDAWDHLSEPIKDGWRAVAIQLAYDVATNHDPLRRALQDVIPDLRDIDTMLATGRTGEIRPKIQAIYRRIFRALMDDLERNSLPVSLQKEVNQ